jgi:hypothetical protein
MKLYAALFLALLVFTAKAEDEQDETLSRNGYSLRFIGKAPKFQFAPSADNSSWVRVEFGSVYEQTDAGQKVAVHTIESLAAVKPEFTTGELGLWSGVVRPHGRACSCCSSCQLASCILSEDTYSRVTASS